MRTLESKLVPRNALAALSQELHSKPGTIISTNGCFDILHLGHIRYLSEARSFGTVLVVGVNSDASVKKLKGPSRPVFDETTRALQLAALECVDFVTVFAQPTPETFLSLLKPHIHVKGGDYKIEDLPERKTVAEGGGTIRIVPLVPGNSSSSLIDKIQRL